MVLNELAVNSMTEEDVIKVIKKSCELRGAKLLKVNYVKKLLQLVVLVEGDIYVRGAVSLDVESVLCGFADSETLEFVDNELADNVEGPCPDVMVINNNTDYIDITSNNGGINYEF